MDAIAVRASQALRLATTDHALARTRKPPLTIEQACTKSWTRLHAGCGRASTPSRNRAQRATDPSSRGIGLLTTKEGAAETDTAAKVFALRAQHGRASTRIAPRCARSAPATMTIIRAAAKLRPNERIPYASPYNTRRSRTERSEKLAQ